MAIKPRRTKQWFVISDAELCCERSGSNSKLDGPHSTFPAACKTAKATAETTDEIVMVVLLRATYKRERVSEYIVKKLS